MYDEQTAIEAVRKKCKVNVAQKTIEASKDTCIGNKLWGKIGYLQHQCGYTFIWRDQVKDNSNNNRSDDLHSVMREEKQRKVIKKMKD